MVVYRFPVDNGRHEWVIDLMKIIIVVQQSAKKIKDQTVGKDISNLTDVTTSEQGKSPVPVPDTWN